MLLMLLMRGMGVQEVEVFRRWSVVLKGKMGRDWRVVGTEKLGVLVEGKMVFWGNGLRMRPEQEADLVSDEGSLMGQVEP